MVRFEWATTARPEGWWYYRLLDGLPPPSLAAAGSPVPCATGWYNGPAQRGSLMPWEPPEQLTDIYLLAGRCAYCGADPAAPTWEVAAAMGDCNNCMVDVELKGRWNQTGMAVLAALYQQEPDDPRWPIFCATMWPEEDNDGRSDPP